VLRMLRYLLMTAALGALAWLAYSAAALDQLRRFARRTEQRAHQEVTP
jgi:hypothetical protein